MLDVWQCDSIGFGLGLRDGFIVVVGSIGRFVISRLAIISIFSIALIILWFCP